MARQIVIQPNGLYGCWSTISDSFVAIDLTKDEYIEMRSKEAYEEKKREMEEIFNDIDNKEPFTMNTCVIDYNKCIELQKRNR